MRLEGLVQPVHAADDPRVAPYRVLKERDTLEGMGVFLGEGRLVVERMLSPACRFRTRSLLVVDSRLEGLRPAIEARLASAQGFDAQILTATRALMDGIVGFHFHQGCLALGELPRADDPAFEAASLLARLETNEARGHAVGSPASLVLPVLEDLVDLDNLGACFRNSAALGAPGILLSPRCAHPLYRKSIRTSMGHALLLPFARIGRWPQGLATIRDAGFTITALTPAPDAIALHEFAAGLQTKSAPGSARPRVALLVGTEGEGLTQAAMAAADARVRIPMHTGVDSLNVATALAIALHALTNAR